MKKTVLFLYGGKSVEHEISIRSAVNVVAALNRDIFDPEIVGITKQGDWYLKKDVDKDIGSGIPVQLRMSSTNPELIAADRIIRPELVFPVLHGTDGEDGSLQGLFKTLGLPVVGTGVLGSSMAMDKIITKKILQYSGIPTSDFRVFSITEQDQINFDQLAHVLGVPFMIKSSNQGSSVGISKVTTQAEMKTAINEAFKYSAHILVEAFVEGMEVECAIMGNRPAQSTTPGQILLKKDYAFYTYEAKYKDADAIDMVVPAPLDAEILKQVRELSERAYSNLMCQDYARVDVFVKSDGSVFINEINTIPGFTSASMFPVMWENMGINNQELISQLINFALERHLEEKQFETNYDKA